jgi:hypothetical protein
MGIRLYVFLPESDYEQMVEGPARDAEAAFWLASCLGFLISVAVLAGTVWFVWSGDLGSQKATIVSPTKTQGGACQESCVKGHTVAHEGARGTYDDP